MNRKKKTDNRLFLDTLPPESGESALRALISDKNLSLHKRNSVRNVIIILSGPVERESYSSLFNSLTGAGFSVRAHQIDVPDTARLDAMKSITSTIGSSLQSGNTLLVSYRVPFIAAVLAAYFIEIGTGIDEGISRAGEISPGSNLESYRPFLSAYHEYCRRGMSAKAAIPAAIKIANEGRAKSPSPEIKQRADGPPPVKTPSPDRKNEAISIDMEQDFPRESGEGALSVIPAASSSEKARSKKKRVKNRKERTHTQKEGPVPAENKSMPLRERTPFYRSIRFKLVTIISTIIIFSLTGMIFLATYYFKEDNIIRIQENNHRVSEVIALKLRSEIEKYQVLSVNLLESQGAHAASDIFNGENDIIFTGIITAGRGHARSQFKRSFLNSRVLKQDRITGADLAKAHEAGKVRFQRALAGETIIYNISPLLDEPVLAIALPYKRGPGRRPLSILVSYVKLDSLMEAFKSTGITKVYMINRKGGLIVHSDRSLVVSAADMSDIPICKKMMTAKLDNGQTSYRGPEGVKYLGSYKRIGIGGSGIIATVEEGRAMQAVYNIQRRNFILMGIVLITAFLIVFIFGRTITLPIIRLVDATKKIIQGDYRVTIRPSSKDEVGNLTGAFIEMGQGLEEREKIKSAFGKFVNKEIAEAALHGDLHLGGERKEVVIFFSDIRSFTAISERMEPERVVEFLNDYMTRMVRCVETTQGIVDKFIGDAIMAVWGTPVSQGNDTANAIESALLMRKELASFNLDRGTQKDPVIRIGCGINTGPVLAGQIGSEERMEYTVIGDSVNLASRIEALNKPFGTDILVTEDSYAKVKDIYAFEKMKKIRVKGKAEPQQIYAVLGRLDDPNRPKSAEELRSLLSTEAPAGAGNDTGEIFEDSEVKYEIIEN